jgi:hypothetical protein
VLSGAKQLRGGRQARGSRDQLLSPRTEDRVVDTILGIDAQGLAKTGSSRALSYALFAALRAIR